MQVFGGCSEDLPTCVARHPESSQRKDKHARIRASQISQVWASGGGGWVDTSDISVFYLTAARSILLCRGHAHPPLLPPCNSDAQLLTQRTTRRSSHSQCSALLTKYPICTGDTLLCGHMTEWPCTVGLWFFLQFFLWVRGQVLFETLEMLNKA